MRTLFVAALAVAGVATIPRSAEANPSCQGKDLESRMECKLFKLLNDYRAQNGRKRLASARQCYRMAKAHTRTMRKYKTLSHEVRRGQDPNVRANKFGLGKARTAANKGSRLRYSGENLSRYHATPEDAMRGWRWSIWGHNANMLRPGHTHVGIGLSIARDSKGVPIKGQYYWAQVFCARK